MYRTLEDVTRKASEVSIGEIVLAGSDDREGLLALKEASERGIADPLLVGNKTSTTRLLSEISFSAEIINATTEEEIAEAAVKAVASSSRACLMKGKIKTSSLLKAVLDKNWGLRTGRLLSHVACLDVEALDRLVFVSDGGMVVKPDLSQKVEIVRNGVDLLNSLGYTEPAVAMIAAVETVNTDMPETVEAAVIAKMHDRNQIQRCILDGPLGLDNALSIVAARTKGLESPVAGIADLLVVPDIHSGNFLGKSAVYLAGGTIAGLIVGAAAPIIVVSRADSSKSKLASIALATISASDASTRPG
ncbi:MAG TPA: phosphate butyryltransferase [Kosmotogaceae bacterium]|nr:MAG: Phosphate butyryltransferase [Thermotogales bacterium 46_20]HAA85682.1 phosphate butyryltransferase [Kosmotogaceae bacterium]